MSRFLISVVIPMYNAKDTIISAVNSVIEQSYLPQVEIIIVNDGSSDGCNKLVEDYILQNSTKCSIKLFNQPNTGVSSARNVGIRESQGEWIALLDSDDFWHVNKLERQFEVIRKKPYIELMGTNVNNLTHPFFWKTNQNIFTLNPYELIIKWYPSTPTIVAKKELLIKAGLFDETKRHGEDCDLWIRCLIHTKLYILNQSLVEIGNGKKSYGEKGLSVNLVKMYRGELSIIRSTYSRSQINLLFFIFSFAWITFKFLLRILNVYVIRKLK